MTHLSPERQRKLKAMGIDLWVERPSIDPDLGPRVRMASGSGRWLLVQRQPWRGQHEALLQDIQATLGVSECRFAQWANSQDAGVAVSELPDRGVEVVLSFGPMPMACDQPHVVEVPELEALHHDAAARQSFWSAIRSWL